MAISRPRQAFNFFRQKGLSEAQSAGLVGNLMQESGPSLDTTASGDDGSAFGMAQWRLDRRDNLEQKAEERGVEPSNFNLQLEHTWDELIGPERQAFDRLIRAETPEEATTVAQNAFFRPNPDFAHTDRRINFATELLPSGQNQGQRQVRGPMGDRAQGQSANGQSASLPSWQDPTAVQIAGEQPMANGNQQQQILGLLAGGGQQQEEPGGIEGLLGNPLFTGGLGLLAAAPDVRRGNTSALEALTGAANLGTGMASQMQDIRSQRQELRSNNRINQVLQENPAALGLNAQQAAAIQALPAEQQQQVLANVASQGQRPTSEMRNLRAAGIDPSSEEGRQFLLGNMSEEALRNQLDLQEQQLSTQQQELELERSRREAESEQETERREIQNAQNAAISTRDAIHEMAGINERLEGTPLEPGAETNQMAATAALFARGLGGQEIATRLGMPPRLVDDFRRYDQLANNVLEQNAESLEGRVTNARLQLLRETKPGTHQPVGTNRQILSDMLEGTQQMFDELEMEPIGRERDQNLVEQWRSVGEESGNGQNGQSVQPQAGVTPQDQQGEEELGLPNFQEMTDEQFQRWLGDE